MYKKRERGVMMGEEEEEEKKRFQLWRVREKQIHGAAAAHGEKWLFA